MSLLARRAGLISSDAGLLADAAFVTTISYQGLYSNVFTTKVGDTPEWQSIARGAVEAALWPGPRRDLASTDQR